MERILKEKILFPIIENFIITREAYYLHQANLASGGTIEKGILNIKKRWLHKIKLDHESQPIFIFSAGWRSGSTLVQRLIMSSKKYFIWGEPYGGAGIIENLANQFRSFTNRWPVEQNFLSQIDCSDLEYKWIANLTPDIEDLIDAHITYLKRLFYYPIRNDYYGWGLKEVRLNYEHAIYLNFLFPNAKFIFLVRNPLHAYRSYKRFRRWYISIPDKPVFNAISFARFWNFLAKGFFENKHKVNCILIKYEDLKSQPLNTLSELSKFLNISINQTVLTRKVGSSNPKKFHLNLIERLIIKVFTRKTALLYGYYK